MFDWGSPLKVRLVWRSDYKVYKPDTLEDRRWVKAARPYKSACVVPIEEVDDVLAYVSHFGYSLVTVGGPDE